MVGREGFLGRRVVGEFFVEVLVKIEGVESGLRGSGELVIVFEEGKNRIIVLF